MQPYTLVNGEPSSTISLADRGLAYGDGLFETIKVNEGVAEFLDLHIQRLMDGCHRLKIQCDFPTLRSEIKSALRIDSGQNQVLKVIITRGASGRGYAPNPKPDSTRIVSLAPNTANSSSSEQGVIVRLCDTRLSVNPLLAGVKHLNRLENVLARGEWTDPSIAEGLMQDIDGHLVEGTMSNLFLVEGDTVFTPRVDRCGVEGVMRRVLLELIAEDTSLQLSIDCLELSDLYRADEVFLTNSLIGIWPVVAIDLHQKSIGPITRKLQQSLGARRHA